MSTWTTAVLTNKGEVLLSKLTAGNTLRITRAVTGSGYVDPANLKSATAVSSPKQTLAMRTIRYPEPGKCALPLSLTNDGLSTGYTATQVGIFAQDPDEGEILYFIAQATSGSGTEIPAESTIKGFSAEWVFYFRYGQADGVTVTVDPSNSVSYEEFLEANQEIYAALALKADQTDLDTTNANLNTKLNKSGGTMTGQLLVEYGGQDNPTRIQVVNSYTERRAIVQSDSNGVSQLWNRNSIGNGDAQWINIKPETVNIDDAISIARRIGSQTNSYKIFGEHNLSLLASAIQTMLQNGGLSVIKQIKQGYISSGSNSYGTITIDPPVNKNKTMLNLLSAGGERVNINLDSDGNIHYTRDFKAGQTYYTDFRWQLVEFY